jgi:MYXO-CTERM domain-containing protein
MKPSFAAHLAHVTLAAAVVAAPALAFAWTPLPVASDPLLRMPGTQPGLAITIQTANGNGGCFDCHANYDPHIEQGFLWQGSTMGQAARDPFFWAAMTVAAQDSIYAFGNPNGADLCERCHLPKGWIEGRADPANGSAMTGNDFDGVQCGFCHVLADPFFVDTYSGAREGSDWVGYWDETNQSATPSQPAATMTLMTDEQLAPTFTLFDGAPIYDATYHFTSAEYDENANGQYFASTSLALRGPFADAATPHDKLYSRYHKSKYFCSTCHDVSNTQLANASFASTSPNDGKTVLPSESQPAHAYFPIERTFSEFMLSDYGQPGGAAGEGPFATLTVQQCQDCHMPDATGVGSNQLGSLVRPTQSIEHPNSGVPVHDMTGGNALLAWLLASTVPASANYDATNATLLGQGPAALTLDLGAGVPLDPLALLAASNRTVATLLRAAGVGMLTYDPATGAASFRIQNYTGHKLISGYAEGRRMFVTVTLSAAGSVVAQVNPYDTTAATLRGLPAAYSPNSPPLGPGQSYDDALVYEARPSSSITGEAQSFHFLLSDGTAKDNRIPPKGFLIAEAAARGAVPASGGVAAPGLFTAAEYAGGYQDVTLMLPTGGDAITVDLYYQATSREYVEFLQREIDGTGTTLASPTPSGDAKAYIAQTDPFFAQLRAWGDTIFQVWQHNVGAPGEAPILMAGATYVLSTCAGQPDGTACDDGNACTTGDACKAGACVGGPPPSCDDGNPCTDDSCDPALGCVHALNTATCDDGNACTTPDTCAFGVCVPGPLDDCDDHNGCTVDSCDPATGCVHMPLMEPWCMDAGADGGGSGGATSASSSTSIASSSTSSSVASSSSTSGASSSTATTGGSTGGSGGAGGMGGGEPGKAGGCSCEAAGAGGGQWGAALLALLGLRRRRRARSG